MARKLDEAQMAELQAFVDALVEAGGFASNAELARESGYDRSALSDLRNGHGAIDGYNLLRLIRAAAARAPEMTTEQLALGLARATAVDAEEETVLARLDELSGLVAEALELLRQQRPPGPQPRRRATGGGPE